MTAKVKYFIVGMLIPLMGACAVKSSGPSDFVTEKSIVKTIIKDRIKERQIEYQFASNMEFKTISRKIGSDNAKACEKQARYRAAELFMLESCNAAMEEAGISKQNYNASLFNRGLIYMNLGDLDKAVQDFEALLLKDPQYGDAYLSLGTMSANAGRFEQAKTFAQKALSSEISQPERAHVLLGFIAEQEFNFGISRAAYQEALRIRPGSAAIRKKLERLNRLWPENTPTTGS